MSDYFARMVHRRAEQESTRVENDLRRALGKRTRLPHWALRRLGYEVIYQVSPHSGLQTYRGIRRHGKWLIDHYPEWPFYNPKDSK